MQNNLQFTQIAFKIQHSKKYSYLHAVAVENGDAISKS